MMARAIWKGAPAAGWLVSALLWASPAPAQAQLAPFPVPAAQAAPGQEQPRYSPLAPPQEPGAARPVAAGLPESIVPFPAFHLVAGTPQISVDSSETAPDTSLHPGKGFAQGAFLGLDWVGEYFRAGYLRVLYRHDLPGGTTIGGRDTDFLSIESDEIWGHAGARALGDWYAALGLGIKQRRIRFRLGPDGGEERRIETAYAAGALLEYAVGLPFVLQLRYVRDLPGASVEAEGVLIALAYTVPL